MNATAETYKGIKIRFEADSGFYGSNGGEEFGYCDTLADIRAEIDDYWAGDEHGPLNGFFPAQASS